MAGPMRDTPPTSNPPNTANFEYDDNEWDIGIGDLIIDLDADIEKTGVGEGMATPKPGKMHSPVEHQATVDKGLKMKIKRTKPGTKHEIVKSGENGEKHPKRGGSSSHRREKKHGDKGAGVVSGNPSTATTGATSSTTTSSTATMSGQVSKTDVNGVLRAYPAVGHTPNPVVNMKRPANDDQQPSSGMKKVKSVNETANDASVNPPEVCLPEANNQSIASASPSPPPSLIPQLPTPPILLHSEISETRETVDVCVGTSVGTITEPDCLGPCEPGTSVTLEGIVWHETEGVLVVNVTWRGKTYVGTLLDCSKHDWAPPRFCESPISDLDARTPKGRGKRGRSTTNSLGDLSNFTETRSSVHSKLRSNLSGAKGRKGPSSSSPTPFSVPKTDLSTKRKAKPPDDENNSKRKVPTPQVSSSVNNPVLLECPEPNCSKKYKHINGLKYHQSHAHGSPEDEEAKESGVSDEEFQSVTPTEIKKEDTNASCIRTSGICDEPVPENEEKCALTFSSSDDSSHQTATFPAPFPPNSSSPATVEETNSNQILETQTQTSIVKKIPQFKVKPASELMSEETKLNSSPSTPPPPPPVPALPSSSNIQSSSNSNSNNNSSSKQVHKVKKSRKSPIGSPNQSHSEPPALGIEVERENIQSPAYSDISDDTAPLLESEVDGKPKRMGTISDKKESGQSPQLQPYGMYPYYGQPPYLVPSVSDKAKEQTSDKVEPKNVDKEKKEGNNEFQQKFLQQHYYQFGYRVSGFPYHVDGYHQPVVVDEKKEEKQPTPLADVKPVSSTPLHIPTLSKPKSDVSTTKDDLPPENEEFVKGIMSWKNDDDVIKDIMSLKNDDVVKDIPVKRGNSSYAYPSHQQTPQNQEELRRVYMYPERKEASSSKATPPPHKATSLQSPKTKDKLEDSKKEKREEDKKQEGVKPTMETQGPPPPPTSQFAYIHPGYMQSPHYGALPFDPSHPVYRGMNPMLVSGFPNSPYLHPQLHAVPRYHAPEDLSRPQTGKALDLLQHHASQYYSHPTHKIHELQERAIKSPTPKTSPVSSSPSSVGPVTSVTSTANCQGSSKITAADSKDGRSPPPQRHVHTHHHTHVGLGYPILAGQYPAPYGAAVLASEHAAAVSSVQYQPK